VINVEKGWRGVSEINRVTYDPKQINVQQMEYLLKKAGTYIRRLPPDR